MTSTAQQIQEAVTDLLNGAQKLDELLEPFESAIDRISAKPLKQMGVSEKLKVAQLLLSVVDSLTL